MSEANSGSSINRRNLLKGVGAGSTLALAGCVSSFTGGDGGDSDTLSIALMFPQSGAYAVYGEDGNAAADLAEQQLNEAGDGPEVEITSYNTEISPEAGVQRAREAVLENDEDALVGYASSSVALATAEFVANQDAINVSTVAQTPQLNTSACNRKSFRTAGDLVQINRAAAQTVNSITDISPDWDMATIYPDYVFGQETWGTFKESIRNEVGDISVVSEQAPAFGAGEFQNEIQAMLNADPDIVYTSLSGSDMIAFVRQASEIGFFEEIEEFVHVSGAITDTSRALGDDMVEMIAADRYFYQYPDTERNRNFVQAYQDMHGEIPVNTAQETYAGILGIHKAAMEGGGTDVDSLVDGMEGLTIEAPEGDKYIRPEDHQSVEPNLWIGRIGPVDYADFYGFTEMNPVPGSEVIPEPNCDM
jgi:branched-chain amino acid transport system substrate-binding protein